MIGLSNGNTNQNWDDIDFGITHVIRGGAV